MNFSKCLVRVPLADQQAFCGGEDHTKGLSKLEYFAAQALGALIARGESIDNAGLLCWGYAAAALACREEKTTR